MTTCFLPTREGNEGAKKWTTSKSKFPMNDYVLFMIQKTILEVGQSHDFNLTMNTPLITTSICEHCLWKRIGIV